MKNFIKEEREMTIHNSPELHDETSLKDWDTSQLELVDVWPLQISGPKYLYFVGVFLHVPLSSYFLSLSMFSEWKK